MDEFSEIFKAFSEIFKANSEGRLIILPAAVGDTIWEVLDECDFLDDCHTKQKCKGCEYHEVSVSPVLFHLRMLDDNGLLQSGYYLTYEEADNMRRLLE